MYVMSFALILYETLKICWLQDRKDQRIKYRSLGMATGPLDNKRYNTN